MDLVFTKNILESGVMIRSIVLEKHSKEIQKKLRLTPTLQKPEGFRVKASEGEVVVVYFKPSATQNLKPSGFPKG